MIYWHDLRDFFLSVAKQDLQKTHQRGPFLILLVPVTKGEVILGPSVVSLLALLDGHDCVAMTKTVQNSE